MKFFDYLEQKNPKQSMHISHIEELIFEGDLDKVIDILNSLVKNQASTSIKFDGCIHPETIILTKNGDMTIKEIIDNKKSISVLTYNFDTNIEEFNEALFPRINNNEKNWVEIEFDDGSKIKTTEDHEFYTENRGWIMAKNLLSSDILKQKK